MTRCGNCDHIIVANADCVGDGTCRYCNPAMEWGALEVEEGDHVRALYPNASWGEGTVVSFRDGIYTETGELAKPLTVQRSDGSLGYFHLGQVVKV